jgi:hypothetical protein
MRLGKFSISSKWVVFITRPDSPIVGRNMYMTITIACCTTC